MSVRRQGKLVESHESLPWQRRGYLRKAMLDRLTTTAGWAPALDTTGVAGGEEERDSDSVREFLDAQRSGWGAKFAAAFAKSSQAEYRFQPLNWLQRIQEVVRCSKYSKSTPDLQ